jgi:hypothetical protein
MTKRSECETADLPTCPYCGKPTDNVWGRHESCHNRVHGLVACSKGEKCAASGHVCSIGHDKPHEPKSVSYDPSTGKKKLCSEKPRCCFLDVGWTKCVPVITVTCAPMATPTGGTEQ